MALRYLTAGESHGPRLVAILEGLPAGLKLTPEVIEEQLSRRQRRNGAGPRMKIEIDHVQILSGVMEGVTTGAPLAMEIENRDHAKWKGVEVSPFTRPRPGHADLTGAIKYGYRDLRPSLERASARETAARVAVGAVCRQLLRPFEIKIGGYVRSIGEVVADVADLALEDRARGAEENNVCAPNQEAAKAMEEQIRRTVEARDTLGGTIEVFAIGLPPGLGSHVQWDRRLDARLGAAVLSVQAIKGVEFGSAFENSRRRGTEVHDAILLEGENLIRPTNNAGGLEGGITNGEPVLIRAAMKPIATTLIPQRTVDLAMGKEVPTQYERSDFCPVPRAVPILEAVVAYVLVEALLEKLGGDSMGEILPRYQTLRRARLSDLKMDGTTHMFWPEEEV
ncbi:MAG: chorismate synthase [Chloroflexi bacterium RBG_16_48_8]|nr:MAG: chorismate synthase [Chloroflexi bacterium RBG_16_48_8]